MEFITRNPEPTPEEVREMVERHRAHAAGIQRLYDYYLGRVEVDKGSIPAGRPDNRANTNLAKYITDTAAGFTVGVPVSYHYADDRAGRVYAPLLDENDEAAVNLHLAQDMSIAGTAYELVFLDADKRLRFVAVDPRGAFIIREHSVERRPVAGVRYWRGDRDTEGELYLPGETRFFRLRGRKAEFTGSVYTPFTRPNLHEIPNGRFALGDFQPVTENIDAYNLTLSYATDDLQSIANAYLVLGGFENPDEETLEVLRTQRVIGLPADGSASYITKDIHDSAVENHKTTLKQDIMQVAGVPDLSDRHFSGTASGVALRYKMWAAEQMFRSKCAWLDKGLFDRLELLRDGVLATQHIALPPARSQVTVQFTPNMPRDLATDMDNAVKMADLVSRRTLHEQLEPVTGVLAAEEGLREQAERSEDE